MILEICQKHDLTCYAFDVTKECFLKNVSKNRNYSAFVFYAVNNHCYQITDQDAVQALVKSALDIETKIKTSVLEDDYESNNIFRYTDASGNTFENPVVKNIPIDNL